jgi:hypothetical protein
MRYSKFSNAASSSINFDKISLLFKLNNKHRLRQMQSMIRRTNLLTPSIRVLRLRSITTSSSASTSTLPAIPTPTTPSPTREEPRLLSYHVKRSPSDQLPVYADYKSGGQRVYTIVRKINGNLEVSPLFLLPLLISSPVVSSLLHCTTRSMISSTDTTTNESKKALRKDLEELLPGVQSHVKPQARQVVLRGDVVRITKEWLGAKGF